MSSIATAVFKAAIGLLVNKGRDKAAEKLRDGDVTDQKFRGLIVREIDDIKSKLDGLSRKDLLASISFFEEGIELLYVVFNKARSRCENGAATTEAAEAFSLAEGVRKLELNGLDESVVRALSKAKKRFEDSRRKATEAFKNEALETSDRILAMQYRVMATILEAVDNPEDAIAPCRVCMKELNSLSAVQSSFNVQLKKGIQAARSLFSKDQRRKIIASVCHVNRVIYDVTQTVGKDLPFWIWPAVHIGEDKVDPLRDRRVTKVLRKHGMEHCCVTPWSFGQEGEEEHKLKDPWGIATNSSGQFIVGDNGDSDVKVFDRSGKFVHNFGVPNDDVDTELCILDVATDNKDNIYVLVKYAKKRRSERFVFEFSNAGGLRNKFQKFPVRRARRLTVTNSRKVLVLSISSVAIYDSGRQFVRTFGEKIWTDACDITAANDGRVMVVDEHASCVHIFSEDGDHLNQFKLRGCNCIPRVSFDRASEHVVVAGIERVKGQPDLWFLLVEIYTKDGEFVRGTQTHEEGNVGNVGNVNMVKMTVTTEGRIAVVARDIHRYGNANKVLVV